MYEAYYKLNALPFQLSPDCCYFYASKNHKKAMSYLQYGAERGEGFVVIIGDVGAGKTTLVEKLFITMSARKVVMAKLVTTKLESDDLLKMVANEFGIEYDGLTKAELLNKLERFMRHCTAEGKRVLLVVDEVQNLPKQSLEELRMLSNFQQDGRCLLQTFLLGQHEFIEHIRSKEFRQLAQRVVASHYLKGLSEDEVKGYIEHRLSVAGWHGEPLFTDAAYSEIYKHSKGIPRKINMICDRVLLHGYLEQLKKFDENIVRDVIEEMRDEVVSAGLDSLAE